MPASGRGRERQEGMKDGEEGEGGEEAESRQIE